MSFISGTSCDIFALLFFIYVVVQAYPWINNTLVPKLTAFSETVKSTYYRSMDYCFPESNYSQSMQSPVWRTIINDDKNSCRAPCNYRRRVNESGQTVHNLTTDERCYSTRNISATKNPPEFILGDQGAGNTVRIAVNGQPLFIIKTEKKN